MKPIVRTYLPILLLAVTIPRLVEAQHEVLVIEPVDHAPAIRMWEDAAGFLWLDSDGLPERYDGYRFVPAQDIWPDIKDNAIERTEVDRSGATWIGALGLLARTSGFNGAIDSMNALFGEPMFSNVHSFFEDARGAMWIGSTVGLSRFDPDSRTFRHYRFDPSDDNSISSDRVYDIVQDAAGLIWVATSAGVSRLDDPEAGTFKRYEFDRFLEEYREGPKTQTNLDSARLSVVNVMIDRAGGIWAIAVVPRLGKYGPLVWGAGYLAKLEPGSETFEPVFLGDAVRARTIVQGPDGRYWVGTSHGLMTIDPRTGDVGNPVLRTALGEVRPHEAVDIFLDSKDVLWLSDRVGMAKVDLRNPGHAFETFGHHPDEPGSLSPNWVDAILPNGDGTYWIGTGLPNRGQPEGGLSLFDRASGSFFHFKHNPNDVRTLTSNGIYALLRTSTGELWVGTTKGLSLFDDQRRVFQRFYLVGDRLSTGEPDWTDELLSRNEIADLAELPNGDLLIATLAGLLRLDQTTGRITFENNLTSSYVLTMPDGTHFLGGQALYRLNPKTNEWPKIELKLDHPWLGHSGIAVVHLFEDRRGFVWASTFGEGLLRLDPASGEMQQFSRANGFPENRVTCTIEDDAGIFWSSTFSGIVRFDPVTGISTLYSKRDGTLSTRFAGGSCARAPSGDLLFGGELGLTIVTPSPVASSTVPPDVAITSVTVQDSLVHPGMDARLQGPILSGALVRLEYDENDIGIEFVGLHFGDPDRLRYEYRMPPIEPDWRSVGDRRSVSFTNLDPGFYEFEVRVWNRDVPSEKSASVDVLILKPWWVTWWAWLLWISGVGATIYGAYEVRVRRIRAHADQLQREVRERTAELEAEKQKTDEQARRLIELDAAKNRFFANISHEFRTPLTLIIAPLQDVIQGRFDGDRDARRKQLGLVMGNARKLLSLIGQLLDLSRLESKKLELNPKPGDLIDFLRKLHDGFVPAAERWGLDILFEADRETFHCLFDPDQIEKIVSNLVGNAVKFTPAGGRILVGVRTDPSDDDAYVEIFVQDSGKGIPENRLDSIFDRFEQVDGSSGGTGIGLALARELAELQGGTIGVESRLGFGSTFTVRLPVETTSSFVDDGGLVAESAGDVVPDVLSYVHDESGDEDESLRTARDSVLVVEDNEDVRRYLKDHLAAEYEVYEAANGAEGIDVAKERQPSLILSDIMMPEMDGYDMVAQVRADDATSHVPVLLLTARADEGEAAKAIQSGADDYVAKPFDIDELKARIAGLIARRRAMREKFSRQIVVQGSERVVSSADADFIEAVTATIDSHLADPDFGTDWLADELALSRRALERRLDSIVGESPAALIRRLRMERASQLLRAQAGTISEIAYSVGFSSPAYFTRAFRKHFDESPSEHAKSDQGGAEIG